MPFNATSYEHVYPNTPFKHAIQLFKYTMRRVEYPVEFRCKGGGQRRLV